jgi:MFS family permease
MGVLDSYRRVLRNGPLSRLLLGEFVSSIGDWLYLVALLVVIWDITEKDPIVLGIVGAARILPYIVLSIPAGIVADRYDRRLILLTTDIIRGLLMIAIAAVVVAGWPAVYVVILSIVATCFSAFFSPAIGAYLPSLVRDESELGPANSAWSSLDNLAFFIGPALGAVILGIFNSLALAILLDALTFAFVAVMLWRLPSPARKADAEGDAAEPSTVSAVKPASQDLRSVRRPLAGLTLLNVATGFVFGGIGVMTVILATDVLKIGEAGTGLLNSAIGVGGVLGALVAGVLVLRRRLGPPLIGGAALLAVGIVVLGQFDSLTIALIALAGAAGAALLLEIISTTLLQRIVPDEVRGRTIGVFETTGVIAYSAGSFVLPIFGATQPGPTLAVAGAIIIVAGILTVVMLGKYAIQEPSYPAPVRRIAEVDLFAGLPPARLETAMRAATVRESSAGTIIIRQGDEADFFYVIDEGRVEVTQTNESGGQPRVLRQMGAGEVFGEIGLLSNVPRTATVTAMTKVTLAVLDKRAFLELVSEGPGLTYSLLDLHRGGIQPAEG